MAKKSSVKQICGIHCPNGMFWLFAALAAWFVLEPFGIPTFGGFWSWIVLLSGVCAWVCASNPAHQKTSCPFAGIPVLCGALLTIIGAWWVLGDIGVLPTFGINLLYITLLAAIIGISPLRK